MYSMWSPSDLILKELLMFKVRIPNIAINFTFDRNLSITNHVLGSEESEM